MSSHQKWYKSVLVSWTVLLVFLMYIWQMPTCFNKCTHCFTPSFYSVEQFFVLCFCLFRLLNEEELFWFQTFWLHVIYQPPWIKSDANIFKLLYCLWSMKKWGPFFLFDFWNMKPTWKLLQTLYGSIDST